MPDPKSLSADLLQNLFAQALRKNDPRPSPADCESLARQFQITTNRANNIELERQGLLDLRKDVSPAEEIDKRVGKLREASHAWLAAAAELESYLGGYQWIEREGELDLRDAVNLVSRIALAPDGCAAMVQAQMDDRPRGRGHPRTAWHAAGREIARAIRHAMVEAGYRGRLGLTDKESVSVVVAAEVISRLFCQVSPDGFATAMRARHRGGKQHKHLSKEASFADMFPGAARIKTQE